jgi:hypothetical protein
MLLFRQSGQSPDQKTWSSLTDPAGRVETENHCSPAASNGNEVLERAIAVI